MVGSRSRQTKSCGEDVVRTAVVVVSDVAVPGAPGAAEVEERTPDCLLRHVASGSCCRGLQAFFDDELAAIPRAGGLLFDGTELPRAAAAFADEFRRGMSFCGRAACSGKRGLRARLTLASALG